MNALALLISLNDLGRIDKSKACQAFYHIFCNMFNKFNNAGALMLDYIYHITLKRDTLKLHFWRRLCRKRCY